MRCGKKCGKIIIAYKLGLPIITHKMCDQKYATRTQICVYINASTATSKKNQSEKRVYRYT